MPETKEKPHQCEKCGQAKPDQAKPDVKYAPDVRMWLCNEHWFTTPPRGYRGRER